MKKYSVYILITILLIIVLASCATKCDDFNYEIIEWMPYKESDTILIAKSNFTDTLVVNYSEIYHTDKIGFGVKCMCENSFILNISSDLLYLDIRFQESKDIEQSDIIINDIWMDFSEQLDSMEINNKMYTDLIIYENTITTTSQFDKIIISKSIGIIAIVEQEEEWKIVDDSEKTINISEIKFKSSDC